MTALPVEPAAGPPRPGRDTLTPAQHLEALRAALVALVRYADRAGPDAPVPTCPGLDVRGLLAHQAASHRVAAAALRGERADAEALARAAHLAGDPVQHLRDGAVELARTVTAALRRPHSVAPAPPAAYAAPTARRPAALATGLADAPPPAAAWARRACHDTTLHALDALAAALGRRPRASETWVDPAVALDAVDELLTGFLPRPVSRLRSDPPVAVLVLPDEGDRSWLVRTGRAPALVTRRAGRDGVPLLAGEPDADVVLRGSAVALALALWGRGDEVVPDRAPDGTGDPWDGWWDPC